MSCETCFQGRPLPRCLSLLTIGNVTASTDYRIRFKSSMGRVDYYDATSDGDGLLVLDLTGKEIMETGYTIQVKKDSDGAVQMITIGDMETDCIEVNFEDGASDAEIIEAHAD